MLDKTATPHPRLAIYLGDQIRILRKARGLTIEAVALMVNTTTQTIQRLETGNMTLSAEWIDRICKVLDIEPYQLFIGQNDETMNELVKTKDAIRTMRTELEVIKLRAEQFIRSIDAFIGEGR